MTLLRKTSLMIFCDGRSMTILVTQCKCHHCNSVKKNHVFSDDNRSSWIVKSLVVGGAEAKASACPQADDGDAFGRRFPSWRHHSFAPSRAVPTMAGRLPLYLPRSDICTVVLEA